MPDADLACPTCHDDGYVPTWSNGIATATPCACLKRCRRCRGSGQDRTDGFVRGLCWCAHTANRAEAWGRAGVPALYAECQGRTFDVTRHHAFPAILEGISKWVGEFRPNTRGQKGLVLYGGVGRGKTHLMVCALRAVLFHTGATVRFVEFSHLVSDLKRAMGSGAQVDIEALTRVHVLAIDELGKGRATDYEGTIIDELVSRRHGAMAPILGTTNYAPDELAQRVGERVMSRLRATCHFVEVPGDDYRVLQSAGAA